ncbi:MAG: hypothetical protein WDN45_08695 [Caulobacteraceae bacterium]
MPPRCSTPPLIINYSASTVPIVQLALSSDTLSEQQMLDAAQNAMKPAIANVPGAAAPNPYGGKTRQILLDLDVKALQSRGPVGPGCQQRHRRPEPADPRRPGQDRRLSVHRPSERHARGSRGPSTTCR